MDHGLLFAVGDDSGPKVRVPVADVLVIHAYVRGQAPDANAAEAEEFLTAVLERRDEVRHFVIAAPAASVMARAIDDARVEGRPLSAAVKELRDHLDGN